MSAPQIYPEITYGSGFPFASREDAVRVYDLVASHGLKNVDTARRYPDSEKTIGELGVSKKFKITTKAPGFQPGDGSKAKILENAAESFKLLGVDKVDIYLLHAPDTTVPFEETMEGIQELYKQGRFNRFGLSNFSVPQVLAIHKIAKDKGYVLPTVYQGAYNLIYRHIETELLPTLRSLGILFQAYSPMAGGFLVKSPEDITKPAPGSRWDPATPIGGLNQKVYNKPQILDYLAQFADVAKHAGVSRAGLAYRWVRYHSALDGAKGDTLIVGTNRPAQLSDTLNGLEEGPLAEGVVEKLDALWEGIKDYAPSHDHMAHLLE